MDGCYRGPGHSPVDGFPKGEPASPLVEAGAGTPVVVHGRESPGRGLQGALKSPCSMGVLGESEFSTLVVMQRRNVASARRAVLCAAD